MNIYIKGKKEDVLSVVEFLLLSKTGFPWTMITHRAISEDFCAQIVTDMSWDDIAKIKDLAF